MVSSPTRLAVLAAVILWIPDCARLDDEDSGDGSASAATAGSATEDGAASGSDGRPPVEGVSGGRRTVRETLVVVEPLQVGPIRDEVVVPARVQSRVSVQVFPKLTNLPVTSVLHEEGDRVAKGDVLLTLYDTELELAERTARALLDEARKEVKRNELKVEEQARRVARAERQAEKAREDLARLEELLVDGLVNVQEVEDARLAADTADDDLELARFAEREAVLAKDLAAIRAERAEADWERARHDLQHAVVRAPLGGVVASRDVEIGELSSLGGAPAFRIVDADRLELDLRVPQDAFARLRAGQSVDVRAITLPDASFDGTVRTVNPVLDEATGTIQVLVDLDPDPRLVPGLFCQAVIVTDVREDALLIDKRAVLYEDDQPLFFAVEDEQDRVRRIAFAAGAATSSFIEVLRAADGSSIPADLRVVVVGQESLKDGSRIKVQETPY